MKKILLTTIAISYSFAAFGQGQVVFENFNTSSTITYETDPTVTPAPLGNPGFTVALLWFNGTSFQTIDIFQSSVANVGANNKGYFTAGVVAVPTFSATGTFAVQGWYNTAGNYSSLAAAENAFTGITYLGQTAAFTAKEVTSPNTAVDIANGAPGGWSGGLELTIPEPGTIALGGLGAAALLLFRRRK